MVKFESMYFLNNIRSMPKAPPDVIYSHFYNQIQKKQAEEVKFMSIALDAIEKKIREINVNTNSDEDRNFVIKTTTILNELSRDIRKKHTEKYHIFLSSLENVLSFEN